MKKTSRSRISNGNGLFFDRPNGRTPEGRRFRDLLASFIDELGGQEDISEAQSMLARRAVGLCIQMELMENQFAGGKSVDMSTYATASNTLTRILGQLGLVTPVVGDGDHPTLGEYLAEKVEA